MSTAGQPAKCAARSVLEVFVKGTRGRSHSDHGDVFVLQIAWTDGSKYVIYRSITDVINVHAKLVEAFPIEAGKIDSREKVLPDPRRARSGPTSPEQTMADLAVYFKNLLQLERKIIDFPALSSFFTLTADDMATPKEVPTDTQPKLFNFFRDLMQKKNYSKQPCTGGDVHEITAPLPSETYQAVESYKSSGKGDLSMNKGDVVEVVRKNDNGWWFVRLDDQEGWAPCTYLESLEEDLDIKDNPCPSDETYLTTKAYQALQGDELSFPCNATIKIRNKVKDGWWVGSYDGKVGLVPASYLVEYSNPYVRVKTSSENGTCTSAKIREPVPRRRTIIALEKVSETAVDRQSNEKKIEQDNLVDKEIKEVSDLFVQKFVTEKYMENEGSMKDSTGLGVELRADNSDLTIALKPHKHTKSRQAQLFTDVP